MDFVEAICWVKVMFSTETVVCGAEIIECFMAISSHGVRFVASEPLEDEGGRHFPPKFIQTYLGALPCIEDGIILIR